VKTGKDFSKVLGESVGSVLRGVLGETPYQALLFYLKLSNPEDSPATLHEGFKRVFGEAGAEVLEKIMIRELFSRLRLKMKDEEADFEKRVAEGREIYLETVVGGQRG